MVLSLVLLSAVFSDKPAFADQQMLFRHLNTQDGLAQNTVRAIHQDRNGYMWFATENGISRYDGYEFRNYYFNPKTTDGLSHQKVFVILEDRDGLLWFGSDKGLNQFNPQTQQFKHYFAGDNDVSISGDSIQALAEIGHELWVGTLTGVSIVDLNTGTTRNVEIDGRFDREIWSIAEDDDGGVWLAAMSGGVWHRQLGTQQWQGYWLAEDRQAYVNSVRTVLADGDTIWLGTSEGLVKLSRSSKEIEHIDLDSQQVPSILDLLKHNGQLWVATYGQGLYRYDTASADIKRYLQSAYDPYALSSNTLTDLYQDNQNRLWVGSFGGGVNYDQLASAVFLHRHVPGDQNGLLTNNVSSVAEINNKLMFATGAGISVYDPETGDYQQHNINEIITLYAGPYGESWASGQEGVYKLSDSGVERIQEIELSYVVSLLQLNADELLVGALDGLWLWNEATRRVKKIELARSSEQSHSKSAAIEYLFRHSNGDVLIGTQAGIYQFDIKSHKVISGVDVFQQLSDKLVTYIFEDENQYLWVGTDGEGLFKLDDKNVLAQYSRINGMPDNAIRGVTQSSGYVWVSTDRGIVSINENQKHEAVIVRYRQRFLSEEFNSGAVHRLRDGQLLFGGIFGAVMFAPQDIMRVTEGSFLSITDVKLLNQSLSADAEALSILANFQRQLTLQHDQNIFSLDFSAFDYDHQGLVYAYRLSGVHGADWIITDERNRRATYTDLNAGNYLFEVRAGLSEFEWGERTASMNISILPPWWQTTLAYVIYILLCIGLIALYVRLRTQRLEKHALHLERLVGERTQEVQTQNKTIERLLDKKSEMFANISHELRTPITLIAGPIGQALKHAEENDQTQMLRLAQRNIKRLNVLVDQLLQLSRLYYVSDEQKIPQCISNVATAITISFESIAHLKQIRLESQITPNLWVQAVPNAMDSLLINLLSNAFKYTEAGGSISVKLNEQDQLVKLSVQDTGVGIPKEQFEHIFERFTRLDSGVSENPEGVGIGLALVKQLLELHEGTIKVDSTENEGSCFFAMLPSIQRPIPSEEIVSVLSDTSTRQLSDIAELYVERSIAPEKMFARKEAALEADAQVKPSLLIIDDIEDMRTYLNSILSEGFECILASSGEQGLELAMEQIPDVVLCDVMMPGMDGFEVLDKMRDDARSSHIPILMLTAKGDRESKIKGWAKLADDYIVKPFDADELQARLHAVLEIRKLQQQQLNKVLHVKGPQDESVRSGLSVRDQNFLEKLHGALEKYFADSEFKLEQLAEHTHLSNRALQRKTKALLGKSPKEYLREYRLMRAQEILRNENLAISDLAERVGFSGSAYFSKCFKAHTGYTPLEYRQQQSH